MRTDEEHSNRAAFGPQLPSSTASKAKGPRLIEIDAARGLMIFVMSLDHANHFIARGKLAPELWAGPFPDYQGDALRFLTRFVTHLAAPGFFFLMGAGMILFAASRRRHGWSRSQITLHFASRGALLVALQFLLENPAWNIGGGAGPTTYFGVLYALGATMMLGAILLELRPRWLLVLSLALILSTEILLPEARSGLVQYSPALRLWLLPGFTPGMYVLYPVLPWFGVVGLGMAFGHWLLRDPQRIMRRSLWLGAGALLLFFPLRFLNGFGNIRPMQGSDWIAFLNLVKYPPSITFLALTLGVALIAVGLFTRLPRSGRGVVDFLAVFGRAALFFYLAHLYLYAVLGLLTHPAGVGIPRMVPFWLLGLAALFPLCWLYGSFKQRQSPQSLLRLI